MSLGAKAILLTFAALVPGAVMAQDPVPAPARLFVPLALEIGVPQGEFAENVKVTAGISGGLLFKLAEQIGLRTELGVMIYGSETRTVPLGNGPLGRINVDVTTTNTIFSGLIGMQVGMPSREPRPYVGGALGFSNFATRSAVSGEDSNDESFASSENYSDVAFSKHAMTGVYLPFGGGKGMLDLGARYTWNGEEVRYLTEGDIVDNPTGPPTITARRTRADLLTLRLGMTLTLGGAPR